LKKLQEKEKMQTKTKILSIMFLVLLTIPMTIQLSAIAPAAAADQMPVYLKVYAEPNPVGVGQTVFISLFFTKPIPIVGSAGGASLYTGLSLNLMKPDGTNETLGPYTSDTTGELVGYNSHQRKRATTQCKLSTKDKRSLAKYQDKHSHTTSSQPRAT
jgi:hypothetical protein